ncbi:MAG: hypothetical protein JRC86_12365, partial [Deltaproteobacteria bacterium]|nr:hypothetical protein [Deltaproteobacteria bacterium]
MKTYFDDGETMTPEKREADQGGELIRMVKGGYGKSARVRETFVEKGIEPSDIKAIEDLQKLPVISREALVEWELKEPPFGGF